MCKAKETARSNIDRLIASIELLTAAFTAQAASRDPESSRGEDIPLKVPSKGSGLPSAGGEAPARLHRARPSRNC